MLPQRQPSRSEILVSILKALESAPGAVHVCADSPHFHGSWELPALDAPRQTVQLAETGCRKDILMALKAAGKRLTLPGIMDAFQAEEIEWSDRTVKRYLGELMAEGKIDNSTIEEPPGYGVLLG